MNCESIEVFKDAIIYKYTDADTIVFDTVFDSKFNPATILGSVSHHAGHDVRHDTTSEGVWQRSESETSHTTDEEHHDSEPESESSTSIDM